PPPEVPLVGTAPIVVDGLPGLLVARSRVGFNGAPPNRPGAKKRLAELERRQWPFVLIYDVVVVEDVDHPPACGFPVPDLVEDVTVPIEAAEGECPGTGEDTRRIGECREDIHVVAT